MTKEELELIKKHVYQLQMYNFIGGFGVNRLISEEAPKLITEIERLWMNNDKLK